jgi:hypothetical protein
VNIRWQAARREVLFLAIAAMEICFFTPMVLALSQFAGSFPPERAAAVFFVQMLVAFYLVRLLDTLGLEERVERDISLVVLLLWVLLTLRFTLYRHVPWYSLRWLGEMVGHLDDRSLWPRDVTIIITTLVFWWRGLELAQRPLDVDSVGYHFRAGVLVMAVSVALVSFMLSWDPAPLVFIYFFVSLVAVALARAEEASGWRMAIPFPFSLGWLLSIMTAAALVIGLALGLIAVFTGEDIIQTLALLGPVWRVLSLALVFVLTLVFRLLYPIIAYLISRVYDAMDGLGLQPPELFSVEDLFDLEQQVERTSPFAPYNKILLVLAVAGAILLVALMFGRMAKARRQLGEVDTDSVLGENGGQSLGARLQKGLEALAERLNFFSRWRAAASIRRIYAQMVAAAARRGYPRLPSETPYEHVASLLESWPGMDAPIRLITEAYVRTHYGEVPETAAEFEAIRSAWEQLQSA